MKLRIFTDGACSGNPGPGGWAAYINLTEGQKLISGGEEMTTNNRMELLSVVKSLMKVVNVYRKDADEVVIISDSAYVVNAIKNGWLKSWKANNWVTSKGDNIKNVELWKKLDSLLNIFNVLEIKIEFEKVKGHSGNCFNELVDKEARRQVKIIKERAGIS